MTKTNTARHTLTITEASAPAPSRVSGSRPQYRGACSCGRFDYRASRTEQGRAILTESHRKHTR